MSYAVAVAIYLLSYGLTTLLPLPFLDGDSVIRVVIFSIPVLLVAPRVRQRFADGTSLVPSAYRDQGGFLHGSGMLLVWIGHLAFFGAIAAAFYLSVQGTAGVPVGMLAGYAVFPYLLGITLVELSFRQWSGRQADEAWKSKRKGVVVAVGLLVAAHLGFAMTNAITGPPVDLLSYHEREGMAWGRGYAREVQRIAEAIYASEDRIPCADDRYVDVDSLLGGVNNDKRDALAIELFECGRFVVTLRRAIDGIVDGQLVYTATPGDADAGRPLDWQCASPQIERIERHTNGGCTYDPSLTGKVPPPPAIRYAARSDRPSTASGRASSGRASSPPVTSSPAARAEPTSPRRTSSGSHLQTLMDRLSEPTLWEACEASVTSYRVVRFDNDQYVAAVRVWRDNGAGSYRSATSSSPGQTIGADGYVDDGVVECCSMGPTISGSGQNAFS